MATNETIDININSSQAIASLRNIERNLDMLTNGFREFMTGVAEGMAGALANTNKASAGLQNMTKTVSGLNSAIDKVDIGKKLGTEANKANNGLAGLGKRLLGLESIIGALAFTQLAKGTYEFADSIKEVNGAAAIASNAQRNLGNQFGNLQIAIMEQTKGLNEIIAGVSISVEKWEKFIEVLKNAAVVVGVVVLWRMLFNVFRIILGINGATSILVTGFIKIKDAIVGFISAGIGGFKNIIVGLAGMIDGLTKVSAALFTFISGLATVALQATGLYYVWQALKNLKELLFDDDTAKKQSAEEAKALAARKELNKQLEDTIVNYRRQNQNISEQLMLERNIIGMTSDEAEQAKLINQIYASRRSVIEGLQDQMRKLTEEQKKQGLGGVLQGRINQVISESKMQEQHLLTMLDLLQQARRAETARLRNIQQTQEAYNAQIDAVQNLRLKLIELSQQNEQTFANTMFDRSQMGTGGVQKQINQINRDAQQLIKSQTAALEAAAATATDPSIWQELQDAIAKITEEINRNRDAALENLAVAREWSTGWNEAIQEYLDSATNMADRAREIFGSIMTNMENAIENFVKTGKLGFKDLVRSIILDLTSMALKQAFRNLFIQMAAMRGGGIFGTIGSFLGSMMGAGPLSNPGSSMGRAGAASASPTGAASASPTVINYNISAIDSRSVAQFFAENRRTAYGAVMQAQKEMPTRMRGGI